MDEPFAARIRDRSAGIGVVGLGYVGMPLAMAYADAGFTVSGLDVSDERVALLRRGESYLMDVPSSNVRGHVEARRFVPTTDYGNLAAADVIFVCVPTPFDRSKAPDLSYVEAAARGLAGVLRQGQLIILESTTYPGTTEEVLVPLLERSGLAAGKDFWVAFSPERIDPGNKRFTIANTPKVVGGIDAESTERAAFVLEQVGATAAVHRVSGPKVAELTKLLENTFRAVNIALVNELAMLCDRMHIDVWEVIEAAKTKPYGFMAFYPGPGVGGHCIPVDPYYLSWKAREYDFSTKFIEIAAETNLEMPFFTVDKIRRTLRQVGKPLLGAKILVLGAAFKRDIDDGRNSAAVRVMEILSDEGVEVCYHDPYIPWVTISTDEGVASSRELRSVELTEEIVRSVDCVAILVGHSNVDYGTIIANAGLVFDAVNAAAGLPRQGTSVVRL
ncbi:MAG: nucleotide sugar dehydrogenase [Candidatus Limnocylindria bacterium]